MNHLDQVNEVTNSAIVTQLSLAIATFALQMSRWEKPVEDLVSRFVFFLCKSSHISSPENVSWRCKNNIQVYLCCTCEACSLPDPDRIEFMNSTL